MQQKLAMLERERSIVGVDAEQDALVADVLFGNEADARAHKGNPANGFLGHRSMAQFSLWWCCAGCREDMAGGTLNTQHPKKNHKRHPGMIELPKSKAQGEDLKSNCEPCRRDSHGGL